MIASTDSLVDDGTKKEIFNASHFQMDDAASKLIVYYYYTYDELFVRYHKYHLY